MFVLVTALCVLSVIATTLVLSVKRIPEGQVYTLYRGHGAQLQLLTPGTHWIVPLRDRVAHKISLTGRALQMDDALDAAHRARGMVYWQVLDPERAESVIDEADALIRRHTLEGLRAVTAIDPIVRSVHLKNRLNDALRPHGVLITRVDVRAAIAARAA